MQRILYKGYVLTSDDGETWSAIGRSFSSLEAAMAEMDTLEAETVLQRMPDLGVAFDQLKTDSHV